MGKKEKILVALSGGVDSALTALLAKNAGYDVVCATLLMRGERSNPDAKTVANSLGLDIYSVSCQDKFLSRVIKPCAEIYAGGKTPNPCCICNPTLKFALLMELADTLGINKVATGHYANLRNCNGVTMICRGVDKVKDQSYFLYRLTPEQRARVMFPLGDMTKEETRKMAAEFNLAPAHRPDSQDVCFATDGENCGETLFRLAGFAPINGKILHQGKVVGQHRGIHRYTLGQRQGLGVALGVPAYVKSISATDNSVELTTDSDELLSLAFEVEDIVGMTDMKSVENILVQVRYRSPAIPCAIEKRGSTIRVIPQKPLRAVTPGQAAVFYDHDVVLGGGTIAYVD